MRKLRQLTEGESGWSGWQTPVRSDYRIMCCKCGLMHQMEFRLNASKQIQFRARRINK